MRTVRTVADLRTAVRPWRAAGESVGLVPTMGALHAGHFALVDAARGANDRVVTTIFVNPTQFGPGEDLAAYPRDEAADARRLADRGVDLLFAPPVEEVYPEGFCTTVTVAGLTEILCGAHRPGHFAGVATVVTKLLLQTLPDRAYFGEKDYQQLLVIRRLARDLDIPVAIEGVPILREEDGLALSSRNAYLSPDERRTAGRLNVVLQEVAAAVARGEPSAAACQRGTRALLESGFRSVDYLEVRDGETLAPVEGMECAAKGSGSALPRARVFAAARVGQTRLIDNMAIGTSG